jgi:hypothetical protein
MPQHTQPNDRTWNACVVRGPDVKSGSSGHGLAYFGFVHQRRDQLDSDAQSLLRSVRSLQRINCKHWSWWSEQTEARSLDDCVALAKALTVAENVFRWSGGSVAGAIWVYREVERRDSGVAADLADWIACRTTNPWLPTGSVRGRRG